MTGAGHFGEAVSIVSGGQKAQLNGGGIDPVEDCALVLSSIKRLISSAAYRFAFTAA
jgi:hypothetical protein